VILDECIAIFRPKSDLKYDHNFTDGGCFEAKTSARLQGKQVQVERQSADGSVHEEYREDQAGNAPRKTGLSSDFENGTKKMRPK